MNVYKQTKKLKIMLNSAVSLREAGRRGIFWTCVCFVLSTVQKVHPVLDLGKIR